MPLICQNFGRQSAEVGLGALPVTRQFAEAAKRGPMSFLAHYVNAESQLQIAANSKESFSQNQKNKIVFPT